MGLVVSLALMGCEKPSQQDRSHGQETTPIEKARPKAPVKRVPQKQDEWKRLRVEQLTEELKRQDQALSSFRRTGQISEMAIDTGPERHLYLNAVAQCITSDRVGRAGDGGKWVCNPYRLSDDCIVYGVGAGDDISFEEEMASKYGCEVHAFDPSKLSRGLYSKLAKGKKYGGGSVIYHPWGMGPVSEDGEKRMELVLDGEKIQTKTLREMTELLGHSKVDLLKLDIEGGEWAVMKDLFATPGLVKTLGIKQFQIEVHVGNPNNKKTSRDLVGLVGLLARHDFLLFRKELNPYGDGCCAEYAFARKDLILDL
jgi:hypothetical protein